MAEQIEPERHHAGGDAGGAAGHDRALQVDAGGGESRGKRIGRDQFAALGLNEIGPGDVDGVRDMAELLEREYVFLAAVEFRGAARVDHLRHAGHEIFRHVAQAADQSGAIGRCEGFLLRPHHRHVGRKFLLGPFAEPAVEHRDLVVAEHAEHPPYPGRGGAAIQPIVNHDPVAVADAEQPDLLGEVGRGRQHMRQRIRLVGDMVDVEMHRSWNMAPAVLRASVEIGAGVMPGAIEHPDVWVSKMLRQPLRAYQRFRICIAHVREISVSESRQSCQRDIRPAVCKNCRTVVWCYAEGIG